MSATTVSTIGGNGRKQVKGRNPGISIVVPVYNEVDSIPDLYGRIKEALGQFGEPWELVLVDDGSQDGSVELMEAIGRSDSRVKVIELRRNFGQTAALAAGFDHARGSVIIPMDADLQNDPEDILRLLAEIDNGYDVVSGWRKSRKDPFFAKKLPSLLANRLASWVTGLQLHDNGCTLKAYRREVLEEINLYGNFHRFIPALASSVGAQVTEIEVAHHPRKFGSSKYGPGRMLVGLLDLLTLKLLLSYRTRPMQFFGGIGCLILGAGGLAAATNVLMKLFMGIDMTGNPLLYLAILSGITGVQLVGLGFLGELNMRTYYEAQGKPTYVIQEIIDSENKKDAAELAQAPDR